MEITGLNESHWEEVKGIYQQGIESGHATFEGFPPSSWESWTGKFLQDLGLVCLEDGSVRGWAAVSRVSNRKVYGGVGEVSLYVASGHQGKGIGKALLQKLITVSEAAGFWTLQAGIFPENTASITLHQAAGFRIIGTRKKIGRMGSGPQAGNWRDVMLLERRSKTVGI